MSDAAAPPVAVVRAMPGTLAELSARTGYGLAAVLKAIVQARRDGARVNAVEDGITRNVARRVEEGWTSTTVYEIALDKSREKGVVSPT